MGITEILRRIWLFSANKIKSSHSFSKQPTQLIVELNSSLRHIIVTYILSRSKQTAIFTKKFVDSRLLHISLKMFSSISSSWPQNLKRVSNSIIFWPIFDTYFNPLGNFVTKWKMEGHISSRWFNKIFSLKTNWCS